MAIWILQCIAIRVLAGCNMLVRIGSHTKMLRRNKELKNKATNGFYANSSLFVAIRIVGAA